jgi:hypothetical protein
VAAAPAEPPKENGTDQLKPQQYPITLQNILGRQEESFFQILCHSMEQTLVSKVLIEPTIVLQCSRQRSRQWMRIIMGLSEQQWLHP